MSRKRDKREKGKKKGREGKGREGKRNVPQQNPSRVIGLPLTFLFASFAFLQETMGKHMCAALIDKIG